MRRSVWIFGGLTLFCAGGLAVLWYLYLIQSEKSQKISSAMMTTLTPLLLALTLLSLLIPFILQYLYRLKLPGGVEVELTQPKDKIAAAPASSIGFGSASLSGGAR
jgi:hypothetical protein